MVCVWLLPSLSWAAFRTGLVWAGGLRIVFAEESILPPAAADGAATGAAYVPPPRDAATEQLGMQLAELHGQRMAFFLALLDAKLGFDTAPIASIQRQDEKQKPQVPPALPAAKPGRGGTSGAGYDA